MNLLTITGENVNHTMNLSTCIHHLTRGENVNYYTTDELVYMYTSLTITPPMNEEARTLTITPPMNLSTCIHHLTRGENVNYYTTDELVYMYTSSYSRRER